MINCIIAVCITVTIPAGLAGLHDTGLYGDGLWLYIDHKVYSCNCIWLWWPSLVACLRAIFLQTSKTSLGWSPGLVLASQLSLRVHSSCRLSSFHHHERESFGHATLSQVPAEHGCQRPILPVILVVVDECSEIYFELLINLLSLSISLWVVCGRGCTFDLKELVKLCGESGHELWPSVGDDFSGKPFVGPDFPLE